MQISFVWKAMTWTSPKGSPKMTAHPRSVSWIAVSVGGLAFFLFFASWILVSYPIGSTVRLYFYGVDSSQRVDFSISPDNQTIVDPRVDNDNNVDIVVKNTSDESDLQVPGSSNGPLNVSMENNNLPPESNSLVPVSSTSPPVVELENKEIKDVTAPNPALSPVFTKEEDTKPSADSSNITKTVEIDEQVSVSFPNKSNLLDMGSNDTAASSDSKSGAVPSSSSQSSNDTDNAPVDTGNYKPHFALNKFFNHFFFPYKFISCYSILVFLLWYIF